MTKKQHRMLLESFWMRASVAGSKDSRMALLRELTGLPLVLPNLRHGRGTMAAQAPADCWCCREAHLCEWHHLIPVKCGGRSFRFNFTALCVQCHRAAHEGFSDRYMPVQLVALVTPKPKQPSIEQVSDGQWGYGHRKPRADRPYGYPDICLADYVDEEWYERLADEYQTKCQQEDDFKAQCALEIAEFDYRIREEEFARGDFSSVENEAERARLEERWQERQDEEQADDLQDNQ